MPTSTALVVSLLMGASTPSCSGPPALEVGVAAIHESITERETYEVSEVEDLARRSRRTLRHRPLGFYTGGFGQEIFIDRENRTNVDGVCNNWTMITVRLHLTHRLIEVASDLKSKGCRPEVVWEHYRKHAAADDTVLSRYVQPVTSALETAWPELQSLLMQDVGNDAASLEDVVKSIIDRELQGYDQIRAAAFADVDSPEEVEKLLCERKI